mmetsp:Transcript_1694/g.2193  ORF Transcript_1694/g.2193 Transcript_1694/m.2193 type:complete len:90 (+) Transcript_1694:444-713(+)
MGQIATEYASRSKVNVFYLKDVLLRESDGRSHLILQEKINALQKLKQRAHLPSFLQVMKSLLANYDLFMISEKQIQIELVNAIASTQHF